MKYIIYSIIFAAALIRCEQSVDNYPSNDLKADGKYENAIKAIYQFQNSISGKTKSSSAEIDLKLNTTDLIVINKNKQTKGIRQTDIQEDNDSIKIFKFDMKTGNEEGFAIACANEESAHVLAYVENGSMADTTFNVGLKMTLSALPLVVELMSWCGVSNIDNPDPSDYYFGDGVFLGASPLLKTKWSQTEPYNYGTPSSQCASGYYLTGCGATAVAQVIAYYGKYKTSYDFSALTAQPYVSKNSSKYLKDQVSSLIASVGSGISSIYGCSVTNSSQNNVYGFLHNTLRYDITYPANQYDHTKLEKTLTSKNLILCAGYGDEGGHIWIIDGYRSYLTYCSPAYVHCNWGWGGASDGWYYDIEELFTNPAYDSTDFKRNVSYFYINEKK